MNFNKLNEKKRLVKGQLIVGLDLAKTNHVAVPMLPDGVVFGKPIRFTQTRESFDDLFSRCQEICQKGEATGIMFAMEATGSYWEPLARHFAEKPVNLVFVAGSVVKRTRRMMDLSRSKNDPKDAYIIAQVASEGKMMRINAPTGIWAELRNFGFLRGDLVKDSVAWGNRIRSIQEKFWPERETALKDVLRKTSLFLLKKCPFPDDVLRLGKAGLLELVLEGSNKRKSQRVTDQIWLAAQDSIGVRDGQEAAKWELLQAIDLVDTLKKKITEVDAKLTDLARATGYLESLESIPGLSAVGAALLLAEVGDPSRYRNAKEWVKLAGLNLIENQSGKKKLGEGKSISKVGRPVLRHVLYTLSFPLLRHNPEFRAANLSMRNDGKHPMKGIIAAMCRLLRVSFSLCKTKQLYRSNPDSHAKIKRLQDEIEARKAVKKAAA